MFYLHIKVLNQITVPEIHAWLRLDCVHPSQGSEKISSFAVRKFNSA